MTTQSESHAPRRKFILCFDGTGNKFSGTDADSNILKIYRMLDRNEGDQFHYYQPGIGTYVAASSTKSASRTSRSARLKSWYMKAKDSAVGTSFDAHVMGGYKFLMRYYNSGDDLYFFGFSRGAYTARFLAEMLDHVGLLSAGNEEMCHFAWKTFQRWQCRQEHNAEDKQRKKCLLEFMCAFRETFSRPVKPIRFLGLFDTVNSVPSFENAWMQRSKFPYTARSSARVIRHAVSIDERRAKFRQDLISQAKPNRINYYKRRHKYSHNHGTSDEKALDDEQRRGRKSPMPHSRRDALAVPRKYRDRSETSGVRNLSPGYSISDRTGPASATSSVSNFSLEAIRKHQTSDSDDEGEQDIREVWFPGCHADIGGGWPLHPGEDAALSHVPLVWMVREAQKAGLQFDEIKLRALHCSPPEPKGTSPPKSRRGTLYPVPIIEIDSDNPTTADEGTAVLDQHPSDATSTASHDNFHHHHTKFHGHLHSAATRGKIHDLLQKNNGASWLSVLSWNIMEYLPFRRMDLQEDGSWKAIVWPLPKGEVRDIPDDAIIHCSVIKRMEADPNYRPGNLIVGGGGRGVRKAPPELGSGKWVVAHEQGHAVGECYVRKEKPERRITEECARSFAIAPNGPQGMFLGR
ncbi:hypothetical protein K458DRAFT_305296 [Lentithecium fluviatile CBS 122367]|uniref:T6SS Phospholipase effector Tle1-like catalytic domain-containing protein n=1 Tax=Lentithecium fluviatile CBS 122367 TaxID=1168545 RepID=A0A6G1IZV5_9PLEO|nr:hypothetical protein K458DRAFT_305296 [Lentithecium fluviatile CBS 122367]